MSQFIFNNAKIICDTIASFYSSTISIKVSKLNIPCMNLNKNDSHKRPKHGDKDVTGKELSAFDELSARLNTLVEMLSDKQIINKKEYERVVAMHLHELSKALAFEDLQEEI